jgi:hypothetical protein
MTLGLCILTGGRTTVLAASFFTLSWTHSIEKTRWEEDWRVTPAGLRVVEARVKGSGAGMEPPEGSVLRDGWWTYAPKLPAQASVLLASSGATGVGWKLCAGETCLDLGARFGEPVTLRACPSYH